MTMIVFLWHTKLKKKSTWHVIAQLDQIRSVAKDHRDEKQRINWKKRFLNFLLTNPNKINGFRLLREVVLWVE